MNDKPVSPGVLPNVDLRRLLDRPPPAIPPGPTWAGEMTPEEMQRFGNIRDEEARSALRLYLVPPVLDIPSTPSNVIDFAEHYRRKRSAD
jgi:hypothetical protein